MAFQHESNIVRQAIIDTEKPPQIRNSQIQKRSGHNIEICEIWIVWMVKKVKEKTIISKTKTKLQDA